MSSRIRENKRHSSFCHPLSQALCLLKHCSWTGTWPGTHWSLSTRPNAARRPGRISSWGSLSTWQFGAVPTSPQPSPQRLLKVHLGAPELVNGGPHFCRREAQVQEGLLHSCSACTGQKKGLHPAGRSDSLLSLQSGKEEGSTPKL